ncbi:hypothetical protein BYT27DRAFT_7063752, partial [Phlegmacium glaucopus]
MWSMVYRRRCTINEISNMNMLVEVWHHVCKGKFLDGCHNCQLDRLIYVLVIKVVPYYVLKQCRQQFGFEGDNLKMAKFKDI